MSKKLNIPRLETLKTEALENIHSYDDPESPMALQQFTSKMKAILLDDPSMLGSLPEYLPIALYGQVKFPPAATTQWQQWLASATMPTWDQFKTSVAFNNADLPFVKAIRDYSESVLIEACAVVFMINQDTNTAINYDNQSGDSDEEGYDDQFDDIGFKGEDA